MPSNDSEESVMGVWEFELRDPDGNILCEASSDNQFKASMELAEQEERLAIDVRMSPYEYPRLPYARTLAGIRSDLNASMISGTVARRMFDRLVMGNPLGGCVKVERCAACNIERRIEIPKRYDESYLMSDYEQE